MFVYISNLCINLIRQIYYEFNRHKKENPVGEIIFGNWDESKFDPKSVNYIPLSDNTKWIFDLE